jgi:hypothetical protein
MSTESSGGAAFDPMQEALNLKWRDFSDIELGNDFRPGVPEARQVMGNTDLFTYATLRATLDPEASDPGTPVTTETGDDSVITTHESVVAYQPIPMGRHLAAAEKIVAISLGIKPAVRLTRIVTDVRAGSLVIDETGVGIVPEPVHDAQTMDVIELVDTAYEPPKVLETYARPEVITTVDDNAPEGASDILQRQFADPTLPTYDKLREELLPEQHTYRGLLGVTLEALGYTAADFA